MTEIEGRDHIELVVTASIVSMQMHPEYRPCLEEMITMGFSTGWVPGSKKWPLTRDMTASLITCLEKRRAGISEREVTLGLGRGHDILWSATLDHVRPDIARIASVMVDASVIILTRDVRDGDAVLCEVADAEGTYSATISLDEVEAVGDYDAIEGLVSRSLAPTIPGEGSDLVWMNKLLDRDPRLIDPALRVATAGALLRAASFTTLSGDFSYSRVTYSPAFYFDELKSIEEDQVAMVRAQELVSPDGMTPDVALLSALDAIDRAERNLVTADMEEASHERPDAS